MSRFVVPAAVLFIAVPFSADASYFRAIDDLPLPPGFTERDAGAGFDSGAGQIVLVQAEGQLSATAVRDFYDRALPALGWSRSPQPDGALVFQRGREQLSFTVEAASGRTLLGARLLVLPASMNAD